MTTTYQQLVKFLSEDNNTEMLNEGKQPLIGVFWIYQNEIIGDTRDPNSSEDTISQVIDGNKIVNGRFTHWSVWNKIKPEELKQYDCYYLPRGRVVSDDTNFKFIVFVNSIANTMEMRTKIKNYYNLSENNIVWIFDDPHYN